MRKEADAFVSSLLADSSNCKFICSGVRLIIAPGFFSFLDVSLESTATIAVVKRITMAALPASFHDEFISSSMLQLPDYGVRQRISAAPLVKVKTTFFWAS